MESRWTEQEVPDVEGIATSPGRVYSVQPDGLKEIGNLPEDHEWADIAIIASQEILSGTYRLLCGESSGHGSMGMIVLENVATRTPAWSLVSSGSNPFDRIEEDGEEIVVFSTSGSVFRFRPPLEEATLSIP